MRYYSIEIEGGPTYTSFENGQSNPAALDVEIDLPVVAQAQPMGSGYVRIWGISLKEISQASNLNNKNVKISAGMQRGLPLANPKQSGVIVKGYIFQAFGNWIGTDQTLDLIIVPGTAPASQSDRVKNLSLNWQKNTKLSDAIKTTLQSAFSGLSIDVAISDKLVMPNTEIGIYQNLTQFSQYVRQVSRSIIGGADYAGVSIVLSEKSIKVFDGTSPSSSGAKAISFVDLIGQPTWIEAPIIQFKTVMRADVTVGDDITLPATPTINTSQAMSSLVNQQLSFQGGFQVSQARHIGRYRQPDAASWVTVYNAFPTKTQAA